MPFFKPGESRQNIANIKFMTWNVGFLCICLTVAPLCFLYNEPSKLYSVFKEMYIRYFFRLHSISSSPSVSHLTFKVSYCFMCVFLKPCLCVPAGNRVSVPTVRVSATDIPATALLPPPAAWSTAVSTCSSILPPAAHPSPSCMTDFISPLKCCLHPQCLLLFVLWHMFLDR